ncbi:flavin reductase family protein [Pseudomonas corrugata]|uniref:flavin reductase family protein n=1 Tax=Pseudomonas corrugata TaxID=47879 RepID=UPI0015867294|nr:flavin reductase family protein [Pseudomonas corrugata]MCI0995181.1 flavin reductase family protein [Pseudomonas corrugata]NUT64666.1 flavin reductase family protein [Pseudomonas corrugata]
MNVHTCTPEGGEAFSPEHLRTIFRNHPAGVTVITLADGERLIGFTATSVTSVSASPPVIAFSVVGSSSSWPSIANAKSVIIHFLEYYHHPLAATFATSGIDRFADVAWQLTPTGEPLLLDVGTWTRCSVLAHYPAGGSFIVLVQPEGAAISKMHQPMVYQDRAFHALGPEVRG